MGEFRDMPSVGGFGRCLVMLVLLTQGVWVPATEGFTVQPPQLNSQVKVWALGSSKVYHCPKSRWYGKGSNGRFMEECQALREGYTPAFGVGCGSDCK